MAPEKIDPRDSVNLRYWGEKLRASEDELRRAVDQVGTDPAKVREHLMGGFTGAGPTS